MPKTKLKPMPRVRCTGLLADVLRYRRGLGRYNLSRLPEDQRSIAALEAWEELETRIENALSKAGVKVS
jgi:hypothetical protein